MKRSFDKQARADKLDILLQDTYVMTSHLFLSRTDSISQSSRQRSALMRYWSLPLPLFTRTLVTSATRIILTSSGLDCCPLHLYIFAQTKTIFDWMQAQSGIKLTKYWPSVCDVARNPNRFRCAWWTQWNSLNYDVELLVRCTILGLIEEGGSWLGRPDLGGNEEPPWHFTAYAKDWRWMIAWCLLHL